MSGGGKAMAMFLVRIELQGVSNAHALYKALDERMVRVGFFATVDDDASGRRVQLPLGTWLFERDGLDAAEVHALSTTAAEEALGEDEDGPCVSPAILVCEARRFVWTGLPRQRPTLRVVGGAPDGA
jgi:hypothetical protein